MKRLALLMVLAACGRDATSDVLDTAQDDLTVKLGTVIPKGTPRCLPDRTYTTTKWDCASVAAMRIEKLEVTNADGTKPWTTGAPRVAAFVRNTSGAFLNYPGARFDSSAGGSVTEQRYGMFGCDLTEMVGAFGTAPAHGTQVTFTVTPISLDRVCTAPSVALTVNAP